MTKVNEEFTLRISIDHDGCQGISTAYGGDVDLEEQAREIFPSLAPFIGKVGKGRLEFGGMCFEWEYTGLQEVPEVGGGDN